MPDDRESDPRERTIVALVDEVQSQRARITALEDQLESLAASSAAAKSNAKQRRAVAKRQVRLGSRNRSYDVCATTLSR